MTVYRVTESRVLDRLVRMSYLLSAMTAILFGVVRQGPRPLS